ncbi:MAG: FMN-binding protein, partial [Deltaproteobacteria bacterium]|nr:FMN-binding protein [Deltaproteobacteria bacterium]
NQYLGKKSQPALQAVQGNGGGAGVQTIDAVTGATISSRAVTGIVNRTIGDVQGKLTPEFIHILERQP